MYDFTIKSEKTLIEDIIKLGGVTLGGRGIPKRMIFNTYNNQKWTFMLKYWTSKGNKGEVVIIEVNRTDYKATLKQTNVNEAIFVGREKLVVVNKGNLVLSDCETFLSIGQLPNIENVDEVFMGGIGKALCKTKSKLILYDTVAKKEVSKLDEFALLKLKNVVWNHNNNYCALITKKAILMMTKGFKQVARINEANAIISAYFTKDSVLIYTTDNHIKYMLVNGDNGILKSVEKPLYAIANQGDN